MMARSGSVTLKYSTASTFIDTLSWEMTVLIHECGELGHSLSHAFGAAFDNPDLIVACIVGDDNAENRPADHSLAIKLVSRHYP
jgi:phosphoketolase